MAYYYSLRLPVSKQISPFPVYSINTQADPGGIKQSIPKLLNI